MNDTAWERTLHALIKEKLRLVHEVPRITT
jgi:hypothetical protein